MKPYAIRWLLIIFSLGLSISSYLATTTRILAFDIALGIAGCAVGMLIVTTIWSSTELSNRGQKEVPKSSDYEDTSDSDA